MKFTVNRIDELKCEPGQRDRLVFDDTQKGLAVRVTSNGSKSYLAQYTYAGQRRRVPLGSCGAVSLADARDAAKSILGDVAKGLDPAAIRKAEAEAANAKAASDAMTLAILVDTWKTLHLDQMSQRYASEAVRALKYAFARQWENPAEDLDRTAVVRILDALTKAGSVVMASRTATYGRACFTWAMKRGTVQTNPFAALPAMGAAQTRDRVLADDELAAIWKAAMSVTAPYGPIVRFLMLTGARKQEVAQMEWAELAEDFSSWTVPATREGNKPKRPHIVPLTAAAREIVKAMPRRNDSNGKEMPFVFAGEVGSFQGWSSAKMSLDEQILKARREAAEKAHEDPTQVTGLPGWRLHDLRRTLATGLQRLAIRLEVTEAVLNHVSGTRAGIVGVYQRHDWAEEKKAALEAWSKHLMAAVEGRAAASNVTEFRQQKPA